MDCSTCGRPIEIRCLLKGESKTVARLHCEALPDDILPSMGVNFLEKVLYQNNKGGKNIVAACDCGVVGFITLAFECDTYYRTVLMNNLFYSLIYGIIGFFGLSFKQKLMLIDGVSKGEYKDRSEIYVIAVKETHRKKGIATALIEYVYSLMKSYYPDNKLLVKTIYSNDAALRLYESLGYNHIGIENRSGTKYIIMEKR